MEGSVNEAEALMDELRSKSNNVYFKHAFPVLARRQIMASALLHEKCEHKQFQDLLSKANTFSFCSL